MTMRVTRAEFLGLEPCPFCGGKAVIDRVDEGGDYRPWYWWTVHCANRECVCDSLCHEYETEAEAIEAWNTRIAVTDYEFSIAVHDGHLWRKMEPREPEWEMTGSTQTQEFWKCSCAECGCSFGVEDRRTFPFKMTLDKVEVPNYCPDCGTPTREVVI